MILRHLPKAAYGILHEITRHLLKRPVTAIVAVARTEDGRYLLIRRGDTGTWSLPGGTLEWGETLRTALDRELEEEGGVTSSEFVRVLGVWSRPSRDPRFHSVIVGVECRIEPPTKAPKNPLEILEARLFEERDLPPALAFELEDIVSVVRSGRTEPVLE